MVVGTVEGAGDRAGSEGEQSMMLGKLEGAGDRAGSEGGGGSWRGAAWWWACQGSCGLRRRGSAWRGRRQKMGERGVEGGGKNFKNELG